MHKFYKGMTVLGIITFVGTPAQAKNFFERVNKTKMYYEQRIDYKQTVLIRESPQVIKKKAKQKPLYVRAYKR